MMSGHVAAADGLSDALSRSHLSKRSWTTATAVRRSVPPAAASSFGSLGRLKPPVVMALHVIDAAEAAGKGT
jgi:hypothetical protein